MREYAISPPAVEYAFHRGMSNAMEVESLTF
jgi:hypothetical protein